MKIFFNKEYPVTDVEWLETDGRGGYASSTVSLCSTRKYHGLFSVPVKGLEGRHILLSGIEPVVETESGIYEFSNSQYPGKIHPEGYQYLEEFSDYPFPSWKYSDGNIIFNMELLMTYDNGLIIRMENSSKNINYSLLKLNFLFSMRNSHHTAAENSIASVKMEKTDIKSYVFTCYESLPPLYINFSRAADFENNLSWIKNTEYLKEMERGFDFREDRIMPGTFTLDFEENKDIYIGVSLDRPESVQDFKEIYAEEKKKRQRERKKYSSEKNSRLKKLKETAHHFFIKNKSGGSSLLAGYPWFGEWGRDTMISLPGLTFFCGKQHDGIEILRSYSKLIKNGLLPNTLSGTQGFESYNSVDASLLYIYAVQQLYLYARGGKKVAEEFHSSIKEIIDAFLNRSSELAFAGDDGFITAGSKYTQLTWMDAMVNNVPVTPRAGAPVDINALWYNGLRFFIELSKFMKTDISEKYLLTAEKIKAEFKNRYWIEKGPSGQEKQSASASSTGNNYPPDWCYDAVCSKKDGGNKCGYAADTVDAAQKDASVRPNMLWSVSLPYSPFDIEDQKSIVCVCRNKLVTSAGLRTLSPDNPAYCGEYSGSGNERDRKYHQGTVWPWLLGIYTEASLRVSENREKTALEIEKLLNSFLDKHLMRDGFGFISEVFDGNNPDKGKGSFAQAWSSAEIIRSYSLIERVKRGQKI